MTIPTWHGASAERLAEVPAAIDAGCATFKIYQAYDGMILDDVALLRSFQAVASAGGSVVLHSETGPVLDLLREQALAAGHVEPIWHERTRPARLEATAIHRAAELAASGRLPALHLSRRLPRICQRDRACPSPWRRDLRRDLPPIPAAMRRRALGRRRRPAIRLRTAVAISERPGRRCGRPWPTATWMWSAPTTARGRGRRKTSRISRRFRAACPASRPGCRWSTISAWPAASCRWSAGSRSVARTRPASWGCRARACWRPGYDADVVIFDPARTKQISTDSLHEAADWTPYDGITVTGWPRTVLARGKIIVEDETYVGAPGDGRFVASVATPPKHG